MAARVLVPLATGCEEIEAITIIDVLRRGRVDVTVAGLTLGQVRASRGVVLQPDVALSDVLDQDFDLMVLPGGLPGTTFLKEDPRIIALLQTMQQRQRYLAAICAAPSVLEHAGVLVGKRITAYPGALPEHFPSEQYLPQADVVVDGNIITSRGPGTAMDFALVLLELLMGSTIREEVETALERGGMRGICNFI